MNEKTNEKEIKKKCPFCGVDVYHAFLDGNRTYVECPNCYAKGPKVSIVGILKQYTNEEGIKKAWEEWNTRSKID